ncbi:MAG: 50S ribosomal protein L19 [bacterium]
MSNAEKYKHIKPGMTVAVDQKIKEETPKGEMRERIQTYEGMVIANSGSGDSRTITVRKVSSGVGVEKILPLGMPSIADIRIIKEGQTRRANLSFMRKPHARDLKEKKVAAVKK